VSPAVGGTLSVGVAWGGTVIVNLCGRDYECERGIGRATLWAGL